MFHFIQNYPFGYYCKTFARHAPKTESVIFLRDRERASLLAKPENGKPTYFPETHQYGGAPLLYTTAHPDGPFAIHLRQRLQSTIGCTFSLMLDGSGYELRLISSTSLGVKTVEELRELPIKTVFPVYDGQEPLIWEFLHPDGTPLAGTLPATLLLVGLSARVRDWAEQWCEAMNGTLSGIEPAVLTILRWCKDQTDGFILIPSLQDSLLAVVQDGNLLLLERQSGVSALLQAPEKLRLDELALELGMPDGRIAIYPNGIVPLKAKELRNALGPDARLFEIPDDLPSIQCADGPLSLDAHVMAFQAAQPLHLFVSENHRRFQLYRKDRWYRGTFHLLLTFVFLQVVGISCWFYQTHVGRNLATAAHKIENESERLLAEEEKLAPLIRRIESVAPWHAVLSQRKPVSEILAGIEATIPSEVCLQRITLLDHEPKPDTPSRLSVGVVGWRKEGFNLETGWIAKLRARFPQFTVTSRPTNEGETLFTLDISQ